MSTGDRATVTWGPGVRPLTVGLVMAITLVAFESLSVATILPVVSRQLGDVRLYGWVFSAFFLSSLIGIVLGGRISDRRGLVLPLAAGLAFFAAGLALAGAAPDMPVLVAGRVVQGVGAGAVPATVYTAIGRTYAEGVRPKLFAVLSTAWVAPGILGPALAAQVAAHVGWRWVFLGLLPLVGLVAAIVIPALATVPIHDLPPADSAGPPREVLAALGVTAGAGLLLAGLSSGQPVLAAVLIVVGVAGLVPSLRRLTPEGTLRARAGLPAAVLVRGLLTFAFFAGDAYVPLTLVSVRHMSTTYAGLALTTSTITWTAGSWLQARTIGRRGPRFLIATGLAVVVVSVAAMATVLSSHVPTGVALAAWAAAGFGIGMAYAPISVTALGWAKPGQEGRASAAVQLCDVLGTAVGTGMAGAAVAIAHQQGAGIRLGLLVAFAMAGAVGVIGLAVSPRLPRKAGQGP